MSSINELNSFNVERIISIKGESDQQIRALETIFSKLCLAFENDNARAWHYSTPSYQQQPQLMQPIAHQTVIMHGSANGGPSLFPTHYPQQQQSIIQQTPTNNNSNNASSKYIEQPHHPTTMYPQPYYVS